MTSTGSVSQLDPESMRALTGLSNIAPAPLQYYQKDLAGDPDTLKFVGKPRQEMDEAWHSLLQGTMIKFSEEELFKAGNSTSIRHGNGGYVGGLGISHSLHCIVRIVISFQLLLTLIMVWSEVRPSLPNSHQCILDHSTDSDSAAETNKTVSSPRVLLFERRAELGRTLRACRPLFRVTASRSNVFR